MGAGEVPLRIIDRGRHRKAALRPLLHQAPVDCVRPHDHDRHGQGDSLGEGREVNSSLDDMAVLGPAPTEETLTVARNVSTRYLAIAMEMLVGLVVLPFN